MNWLPVALLGPLFWSFTNHVDKFLLSKHLKGVGKGALILYSTLFSVLVLPVAIFFDRNVLATSISNILVLIIAGIVSSLAILLYLYALEDEETSVVMPFFQLIPVFGFILGFYLLGETLSIVQLMGAAVIIFGAIILSLEIQEENKVRVKKKLLWLLVASSLLFALYETLFKLGSIEYGFWQGFFWQNVGLLLFGIILFVFVPAYRKDFLFLIRKKSGRLFSLNATSEILTLLGNGFNNFAILLAPIALVMVVNSYQAILVFLEGLLLTIFFPVVVQEKITPKHLAHKIFSIIIVIIGTYILYI